MPFTLLVLSESPLSANRIKEALGPADFAIEWQQVGGASALQTRLVDDSTQPDLYLVADDLSDLSPVEVVALFKREANDIPIIVIVEPAHEAAGLEALNAGAADLFYWDRLGRLAPVVDRILRHEQPLAKIQTSFSGDGEEQRRPGSAIQNKMVNVVLEMQTPISMLGLYIHLLETASPDKHPDYMQAMKQQIEALNRLLQSTLGRTDLGRDDLQMDAVPIDLNQVVSETVDIYRSLAEASGLELRFLPGAGLAPVQGHPRQLAQAVSSLLHNAINYTPAGQIEVRTYLHASRSEVCLKVKDSGLGIGREDMTHIFDRYYRGRSANQQRVLGAGLGLAVAKEIVEAHGGWIDAKSEENIGSVFSICLPVVLASEDTLESRILVVENSQLMRSVLQETLEQEGFSVALAEHGRIALALLDDFKPDLILSDVAMPEMDGYAFLDAVRGRPEWNEVPFIFITGQSDQKDYLQSQAARGASFLLKPIVIEELMTAIRARLA